ncbi:MAG: type II toxin-antitoxin system VapC family toxin [Prevotellaceae bacterium]|nr:type II toxin-antitoxin system VapC family toxin [Prevotellaceae bacterium]
MLTGDGDSIDRDTADMIADPENLLFTSTVCVQEIVHLRHIGKVLKRDKRLPIVDMVKDYGIEIVPINEKHLRTMDELPLGEHRDPMDRLIIAQTIADRALLVSCDGAFDDYKSCGLDFRRNFR